MNFKKITSLLLSALVFTQNIGVSAKKDTVETETSETPTSSLTTSKISTVEEANARVRYLATQARILLSEFVNDPELPTFSDGKNFTDPVQILLGAERIPNLHELHPKLNNFVKNWFGIIEELKIIVSDTERLGGSHFPVSAALFRTSIGSTISKQDAFHLTTLFITLTFEDFFREFDLSEHSIYENQYIINDCSTPYKAAIALLSNFASDINCRHCDNTGRRRACPCRPDILFFNLFYDNYREFKDQHVMVILDFLRHWYNPTTPIM